MPLIGTAVNYGSVFGHYANRKTSVIQADAIFYPLAIRPRNNNLFNPVNQLVIFIIVWIIHIEVVIAFVSSIESAFVHIPFRELKANKRSWMEIGIRLKNRSCGLLLFVKQHDLLLSRPWTSSAISRPVLEPEVSCYTSI